MKRFVFCFAFTAALSYTNISHSMQVARPLTQAAPCFFNEPSFVKVIRAIFAPAFTRLNNPTGSTVAGNPMPIIMPAWYATPQGNGKMGISLATAAAVTTAIVILALWYAKDAYYRNDSYVRSSGSYVLRTGLLTTKMCLTTIGKILLVGLVFWGLESTFFYALERVFHISVNNPQMYNILLTLMAAGFYAMITNEVKKAYQQEGRISWSRPIYPAKDENYQPKFKGNPILQNIQGLLDNPAAFTASDPLLIVGGKKSGKSILVKDIERLAQEKSIPCCSIPLTQFRLKDISKIQKLFSSAHKEAGYYHKQQAILFVEGVDEAQKDIIRELLRCAEQEFGNTKVLIVATARDASRVIYSDKFEKIDLTGYQSAEDLGDALEALLHQKYPTKGVLNHATRELVQKRATGERRIETEVQLLPMPHHLLEKIVKGIVRQNRENPLQDAVQLDQLIDRMFVEERADSLRHLIPPFPALHDWNKPQTPSYAQRSRTPSASASSSSSRLTTTPSISASELLRADSVFDRTISSSSSAVSSSEAISLSSPLLSSANAVSSSSALSSNS